VFGNLSPDEAALIGSPVGRLRALFSWRGSTGLAFVRVGARLALSKWHAARATRDRQVTISAGFIGPLRQELARLRAQLGAMRPR
jgi:hypothetical protein